MTLNDFIDDDRAILTISLGASATVPAAPVWTAASSLSLWVVPPSLTEPCARCALVSVLSADLEWGTRLAVINSRPDSLQKP